MLAQEFHSCDLGIERKSNFNFIKTGHREEYFLQCVIFNITVTLKQACKTNRWVMRVLKMSLQASDYI